MGWNPLKRKSLTQPNAEPYRWSDRTRVGEEEEMINQMDGESRASYLMRVAAVFIRQHASDYTIDYDETTCDGYCLADELEIEAEMEDVAPCKQ